MLNRLLVAAAAVAAASACTPALHLTRPAPPEASLGNVRTLSVDVATQMDAATSNAVARGLLSGELPMPVPFTQIVKDKLSRRLAALGYAVCPAAPCGDGAMDVKLLESTVGTLLQSNGVVRTTVRLRAQIKVKQNDGTETYDYSFWSNPSGNAVVATQLVDQAAENIAARFQSTLMPGREHSTLPLADGGPLEPGVNMLLANNWDSAIGFFTDLTQKQPGLGGAWYDLGVAYEAKGDWGNALNAYEQAASKERKQMYIDAVGSARQRAPQQAAAPVPQPIPAQ